MTGKEKCRALKQIRKAIADSNGIEYAIEECPFQGECKGTCPKCEDELRNLEKELEKRQRLGKAVAIAGVSLSAASFMTGCSFSDVVSGALDGVQSFVSDIKTNIKGSGGDDGAMVGDVSAPENIYEYDDGDVSAPEIIYEYDDGDVSIGSEDDNTDINCDDDGDVEAPDCTDGQCIDENIDNNIEEMGDVPNPAVTE